ncbi:archaea-specific SMC-related protein [Haloarcula litorea]|uniref:archaea-specific SMC-related protein n=1 Tax=Haloarcula litorea TaxID=3032579 RepID=UPI0023E8E930|nr:archaea-specific SMC-related protein [Halomicroarcula sp. GDY20]
MSTPTQKSAVAHIDVENIGGIAETALDIPPGVTVLSGENATNRTSFLQAIMAAMGSDQATLKGDAETGRASLRLGESEYERTLERQNGTVVLDDGGYLDDPTVADLFAFLLETNEARQAVARDGDLRDLIMRPIDTESLKSDIERLEAEKGEINDRLATIESRKTDLPDLEQQRNEYQSEIAEKREELAELESEIDDHSRGVEETRQEQEELESKLQELRSTRSEIESVRRKIENQQQSITSLKQERSEIEAELDDLPETPTAEQSDLDAEIQQLRDDRQRLNGEISDLQSLIQYNEERLDEEDYQMLEEFETDDANGSVTDDLLSDTDEIVCWTCGSTVDRQQIEETIDRLQDLRSEKVTELNDIKDQLEDLKADKRDIERQRDRRSELQSSLAQVEDELDRRGKQIDSLKDRRDELTDDVEELEAEVDALESEDFGDILDLHKEANQLEFEIDQLESDLDEVTDEIETIEEMLDEADDLRAERDRLADELTEKRTKIDQIEADAVERFNDHVDTILEMLDYENLDRIWIERLEKTVREGRQKVQQTAFEIHVVRTTENGAAYEDTIDHLSESEREVTGLVFALAGYLVHDLHEEVPFMLLDSLEAIDSDRIATLVGYFADHVDYLVVALLEEDAAALPGEYNYVTDI